MREAAESILALCAVHALFALLGAGLASRISWLRETGWALLLAPLVGHLGLGLLSFRLSVSGTSGGGAVVFGACLLTVITLVSWSKVKAAAYAFSSDRGLPWIAGTALALQLLGCTGLIIAGIRTYNGYGNLDAWYYATDTYLLKDVHYFEAVAPEPFRERLQTARPYTRVGPEFAVILVTRVSALDELESLNLVLGSFLLLLPLAVAFVCREALELDHVWTLAAMVLVSAHSSLYLAYESQHVAHVFSLSAIPVAVAAFYVALRERDRERAVFAAFAGVGCAYAYWPTLPLYVLPLVLLTSCFAVARRLETKVMAAYTVTTVVLIALTSPTVLTLFGTALSRTPHTNSRNDPLLIAFSPYLTEDLLPLHAGVADSAMLGALWDLYLPSESARVAWKVAGYHASAVLILLVAATGALTELRARHIFVPLGLGISWLLLIYAVCREYAYGAYKLVSWTHVPLVLAFALGLRALWRPESRGPHPVGWRVMALIGGGAYLWLNVQTSTRYVQLSLSPGSGPFVVGQNFSRNRDWRRLEDWAARHEDGPILIGMHQHPAQYWTAFRLRKAQYKFLVPQDILGRVSSPDRQLEFPLTILAPPPPLDRAALAASRYFLDWAATTDITRNDHETPPLEKSATFALYDLSHLGPTLSLRDGWYSFESHDPRSDRTQGFRWMSPKASLLLFRFPPRPVRLALGLRAGVGLPTLDRTLELRHNGTPFGALAIEGTARILSPPIVPAADLDDIEIAVPGHPEPLARRFTLWNRWVQRDPRQNSIGVFDIRAIDEAQVAALLAPRRKTYTPEEIRDSLFYGGLHSDDWLGRRFELLVDEGVRQVRLHGRLDRLGEAPLPALVQISIDGRGTATATLAQYGEFTLAVDLPTDSSAPVRSLAFTFETFLTLPTLRSQTHDMRRISVLLRSVEFLRHD